MYVCEQCHEVDAPIIECAHREYMHHESFTEKPCDICGKQEGPSAYCSAYTIMRRRAAVKKSTLAATEAERVRFTQRAIRQQLGSVMVPGFGYLGG